MPIKIHLSDDLWCNLSFLGTDLNNQIISTRPRSVSQIGSDSHQRALQYEPAVECIKQAEKTGEFGENISLFLSLVLNAKYRNREDVNRPPCSASEREAYIFVYNHIDDVERIEGALAAEQMIERLISSIYGSHRPTDRTYPSDIIEMAEAKHVALQNRAGRLAEPRPGAFSQPAVLEA